MMSKLALIVSTVVLAGLGIVAGGCGGAHLTQLKEAASADLNCPRSRVHILNSGKTRDVEACGQQATYHWEDGDWRMIARSAPQQQPQQQAAPPRVAPAQPAPVSGSPTGTPSQPPPYPPAPGGKQL